jgi:uncharacterized protein
MVQKRALKVPLNTIPETGRDISVDLGKEWFARWQEEDPNLEFSDAALTGSVRLEKHGQDILVRGRLQGNVGLTCSRCLESFPMPMETEFDLLLVPGPEIMSPDGEELSAADLDLDYYTGEVVDLESILREQVILMLPLKALCTEVCKGLCTQCGANLNRETCTCKDEKVNSPFAALAKLKI